MEKHLFFDLDRTLWDFDLNSKLALKELYHDLKLNDHISSFKDFHEVYKRENVRLWKLYGRGEMTKEVLRFERFRAALKNFGINNEDWVVKLGDDYVRIAPKKTQLFPYAHETLNLLKNQGYALHIITNGFREAQEVKLESCNLNPYFDSVVCSEDVGMNKPNPQIFHHTMRLAKAKPEQSIMIGDDLEVDIFGAENVGMQGILFDPEMNYERRSDITRVTSLKQLPDLIILT